MCSLYDPSADTYLGRGQYFSGGIVYNLGSHALDMAMAVLGTPDRGPRVPSLRPLHRVRATSTTPR